MKSRDRRRGRAGQPDQRGEAGPQAPATAVDANAGGADLADRFFIPAALGILLVAAALRLPELALNPFHHDEGVNGFFTTNLVRNGIYIYDPANYHGPSLYYFALISEMVFGLTTEAMRLVPIAFGMLMVGLVFALRRYLGSIAVLTAAALLAISPGAVYVSRYFIHESLLVALTLALVVSSICYLDRRRPKFLLAGSVSAALLFATKETGVITIAVLLISIAVAHVYVRWRPDQGQRTANRRAPSRRSSVWIDGIEYRPARVGELTGGPFARISRAGIPWEHLAAAAVVFVVIYVLLYSSFFTNFPKGLIDSLATFTIWAQHGEATQTHPPEQYFRWMIPTELPILILGIAGGLVAAVRARGRLWVVIGLWAVGITAAYSIIQYKTPWIILNMLLPLALLGGLAIQEVVRTARSRGLAMRLVAPVALVVASAASGYMAIDLNYRHYDDETYGYVYVHTTRAMLSLVDEIGAIADRAGSGKQTGVVFVTPDYWPLPWYMRDYPRAGFFGKIVETKEAMIVANVNQEADLAPSISGKYDRVGQYNLRPGVDLVLYVRSDIPKV